MTRVVGLISGTSVDGIDAALMEITGTDIDINVQFLAGETYAYPSQLREQILQVCAGGTLSMAELAELDNAIAIQFANSAQAIQTNHQKATLIGSHGQTVYHQPPNGLGLGYSLQLGRGEVIAQLTKTKTISNFRVADIAQGGHGAPLVSRIDAFLLSSPTHIRCVQNIGGIGNLTYLPARQGNWLESICGWDTGPGNALIDLAVEHFTQGQETYDQEGNWARRGSVCTPLLEQWLNHDYFQLPPPKSTGRELFGVDYLKACLVASEEYNLTPADLLATLTELTVSSIVHSYQKFLPFMPQEVLLCGGGSRNLYLKERLQARLELAQVLTTDQAGVNADFKEAIAFGILAYWRNSNLPGNLPQVTGAKNAVPLGTIAQPLDY